MQEGRKEGRKESMRQATALALAHSHTGNHSACLLRALFFALSSLLPTCVAITALLVVRGDTVFRASVELHSQFRDTPVIINQQSINQINLQPIRC